MHTILFVTLIHACSSFLSLQYSFAERDPPPVNKSYASYKANGLASIAVNGTAVNGIKGLFAFHKHTLAHLNTATTDYMHALYNAIHDMLCSLRPTFSGNTSLGKNKNRTYKESVVNCCQDREFHKKMWTAPTETDVPPWVLTKEECIESDRRMKSIIGPPGTCRIADVMKKGKAENTHDTLEWAFVYARWCWVGKGTRVYIDNILEIFDVLCILTASTLNIETVQCLHISVLTVYCYVFI